jgi:hypothetical protein
MVRSQPEANRSQDAIWKIPIIKRAGGVAQDVGPEFKPQYQKKKKEEKSKQSTSEGSIGQLSNKGVLLLAVRVGAGHDGVAWSRWALLTGCFFLKVWHYFLIPPGSWYFISMPP